MIPNPPPCPYELGVRANIKQNRVVLKAIGVQQLTVRGVLVRARARVLVCAALLGACRVPHAACGEDIGLRCVPLGQSCAAVCRSLRDARARR